MKHLVVWFLAYLIVVLSCSRISDGSQMFIDNKKNTVNASLGPPKTSPISARVSQIINPTTVTFPEKQIKYGPFESYIKSGKPYVDKTTFIAEVFRLFRYDPQVSVYAVFRPKGYGKSLNLDMLREFLRKGRRNGQHLFKRSMNIMRTQEHDWIREKYLHKTPVIFVDFTNVSQGSTFNQAKNRLHAAITATFSDFEYLSNSTRVPKTYRRFFRQFINKRFHDTSDGNALKILAEMIQYHHNKRPFIIIDAVDAPIDGAALDGYLPEMGRFLTGLFANTFVETNRPYEKAVLGGVLPIQEYLPSHVECITLQDEGFETDLGFTEDDIQQLLEKERKEYTLQQMTDWYGTIKVGNKQIYNPASVMQFVLNGKLKSYATPSGTLQQLTRHAITKTGLLPSLTLLTILTNGTWVKQAPETFRISDILSAQPQLWLSLIHAGILATDDIPSKANKFTIKLRVPGKDLQTMIKSQIDIARRRGDITDNFAELVEAGNTDKVKAIMATYINSAGVYLFWGDEIQSHRQQLAEFVRVFMGGWTKTYGRDIAIDERRNAIVMWFYDRGKKQTTIIRVKDVPGVWERVNSAIRKEEEVVKVGGFTVTIVQYGPGVWNWIRHN